ncbi:alpha/beta hydrolase family protein [Teredinibacter waterburyi]|uniref:alpha/beta hydrolase family protein n=1 Tax=Teredinibacter waterburyi TaxID=1500538 RepID=UPI00165F97E6|nr:prolyl oligopeptidase family serine peptidase [Teredinibacter waterburyi]
MTLFFAPSPHNNRNGCSKPVTPAKKTIQLITMLIASLFCSLSSFAAPKLADYGALKSTSMMRLSPSGELVAFKKVEPNRDTIIVYSLKEAKTISGADISAISADQFEFVSEHELVITASDTRRIRGFIGENRYSSAYVLDIRTGAIRPLLTLGEVIYTGQTGLGRIAGKSADGKYLFMPAFVPRSTVDDAPDLALVKVNLQKKRKPKVAYRGMSKTVDYFMNRQGNIVAQELYNNKTDNHSIMVPDGNDWRTIFEEEAPIMRFSVVGVTADAKSLVIIDDTTTTGHEAYFTMSLQDGTRSEPLFGRDDADIDSVMTDINRTVYGVRYSGFSPSYFFLDKAINSFVDSALKAFPDQSVFITDWTPDWSHLIAYVEGSSAAGDYYLFDRKLNAQFLATARPSIQPMDVNPIGTVTFTAEDGLKIPTLITIPKNKLNDMKNLPAVMLPHGGPESHDTLGFDWFAQALAAEGYLVIQPQFRGSSGFGAKHIIEGRGQWGKKMQSDLTEALSFLVKKGIVNPDKVCIAGMGYGGYAALAGGAYTPEHYKCVVSIAGVSDIPAMLKSEKRDHGKDSWVLSYWEMNIANGNADKAFIESISPSYKAESFQAPVLLIHGEKDKVVPYAQSKTMYKRLKKAGKSAELIKLDDENHRLESAETRLQALEASVNFINTHLK